MATVNLFGDLALDNSVKDTNNKLDALTGENNAVAAANQKGIAALAVRHDTDATDVADGDLTPLSVDGEGRLKTSSKIPSFGSISGALNTVGARLSIDVNRASNVVFHVKNTGSVAMAAGQFSFEGSIDSTDGTNGTWFSIQAIRSNANTIEVASGTLAIAAGAGLAYSWEASVNAYQYMRISCTTAVTALASANWTVLRGTYATEPIPAAQISGTQPVSGTVNTSTPTGTAYSLVTAATTNAASVKATAGNLFELTISNVTATPAYVKLYSKASAPTVGTDVPILTIPVPATTANEGFVNISFGTNGKRFGSGIAIAVTGASVATDTTATVAGIQVHATYI